MKEKIFLIFTALCFLASPARAVWYTSDGSTPLVADRVVYDRIEYLFIVSLAVMLALLFREFKATPQNSRSTYALFAGAFMALAGLILLKLFYLEA